MTSIDLGSVRLYYKLIGQGPPVVFVNGWTLSCEYWQPLAERLQARYSCLLFDGRGFGRSQPLSTEVGVEIDDYAEDLHEVITRLKLKDVNLVGHGLGAWAAILCARRHPQDVISLTAIAPESEPEPQDEEKSPELPSIWQQASLLLKDLASVPMLRNLVGWRYRRTPEPFRTKLYDDFAHADRRAAFHMLASCMGDDNRQRLLRTLSELLLPVMLTRGTEDRLCPAPVMRSFFDIIQRGKLATVRGCGHFPMLEYTDELAGLLLNFFDKQAGPHHRHALISPEND
jgi:3-oxoadipate enol-lactonase